MTAHSTRPSGPPPVDGSLPEEALAKRVLRATDSRRGRQLDWLHEVSSIDAPSGEGKSLSATAGVIASWLTELGLGLLTHPSESGSTLEAICGPAEGSGPETLILCHYDTVWPRGTVESRPLRVEGDAVTGPGVLDMRGGLIAAVTAIGIVLEHRLLGGPVRLLVTPDEETGSRSSEELIRLRARQADLVLVPEPALPDGGLKTARKGWLSYEIKVEGRSAHAGLDPEKGVSAVDEIVDLLSVLRRFEDDGAGTTVNCGVVEGGTGANVVAGFARALIDVRVATAAEEARLRSAFDGLRATRIGAKITVDLLHSRPPLVRSPEIAAAAGRVRALGKLIGAEVPEGAAGGVSDANLAAAEGAVVLDGLGPVGAGAHAQHEWASLDSIAQRTSLIALILAIGDTGPSGSFRAVGREQGAEYPGLGARV